MDEEFLMDFDVVDPPVFARKSAPPPANEHLPTGHEHAGSAAASETTSSRGSQNENSSAEANVEQELPRAAEDQEPMEQDSLQTSEAPAAAKKVRKRNRNKKSIPSGTGPDIPSMLAGLRPEEVAASATNAGPPLPLLPPTPPPPPPPADRTTHGLPSMDVEAEVGKNKATTGKKPRGAGKSGGAQRTVGRIPKISNPVVETHNIQWLAKTQNDPTQGTAAASSSTTPVAKTTSAYGGRQNNPKQNNSVCLDISSYRFLPDDDRRVAIVLRKMRGDPEHQNVDLTSNNKQILHDLPTITSEEITGIPLSEAPGADSLCGVEGDRYVSVPDFASTEIPDSTVQHTVSRRDSLAFLIVARSTATRGKKTWDFPTIVQCQDFINEFISRIYEDADSTSYEWQTAYSRSGKWGKIGTILLNTCSMEGLHEFRRQLTLHPYRDMCFDCFPKDVLTAKPDVTILLRASMKTFKTEMIPKVLFARNQSSIAGTLRILATRFYTAEDISHKGETKEHWRSVELKGDEQFMRCLRTIPESKPFLLGFDPVQIRGGLRPQEYAGPIHPGGKRSWTTANADTPLGERRPHPHHCWWTRDHNCR